MGGDDLRPILYNATETVFDSYGLGEIDANKATVTRERNGNYSLYIEYPVGGSLAPLFKQDMRIKADAGVRTKNQTFYISRIVKDSSHVIKIYAKHISHLTETMGIVHGTTVVGDANAALARWSESLVGGIEFRTWSDIETEGKASWTVDKFKTAREALGGVEGSILDVWGGEYEFDNTTIRLHKQLGRKTPTVLQYGRNILSAEEDENSESSYTSIYPYASYTPEADEGGRQADPVFVTLPEKIVDSQWVKMYADRRVQIVDFSSKFAEKETPTLDKLRKMAERYVHDNRIGIPKTSIKVEYVDLAKTLDYADIAFMEEVELCDIVPIFYPKIGLTNEDGKVVVVNYDVLNDRNESIEIGTIGQGMKSAMVGSLGERLEALENRHIRLESNIPAYLLDGKGNEVWYQTPDNTREHKVGDTWFEKNGLYDRIYVWNGEMWEKRIDTEDIDKVKKEVDKQISDAQTSTNQAIEQAGAKAEEALKKAAAGYNLADEAKYIAEQNSIIFASIANRVNQQDNKLKNAITDFKNEYGSKMLEVTQTTDGLKTKIGEITSFIDKDGQRQEELKRYAREETAKQTSAIRETLSRDYVAKSTFTETVESTNQRFEALTRDNEAKLADYKQGIDGRFTSLASQIAGKVNQADFQSVKETAQLYERILGGAENDVSNNVSRMVLTNQVFQTEVGKYVTDDNNLIVNSMTMNKHTLIGNNNPKADISVNDGVFTIKANGLTSYNWSGFTLPIYVKKIYRDETYTLGFKYRIREYPDSSFAFNVKNHGLNKILLWSNIGENRPPLNEWQEFQKTFTVQEDFAFGEDSDYPFYIFLAKNGWIEFKEPILVRGSKTGPYKPSQFDDAYRSTDEAKGLATDAQTRAIQISQGLEATRTQMTLLSNSWAVKALNNAGDILGQLNLNPDGSVKINEGLISVGDKTYIKDGVIKKSMIGNAQIGTAHIGEIDASQARIINISAKNIVADGLTANIIRGGKLSSLNGVTDFDLQTGWIEMNKEAVGIRNRFPDRPMQFLIFGQGSLNGVPGAYTQLMSNRNGVTGIEHTSAGIQIWNGRSGSNVQTAITFYGKTMDFMPNSQGGGVSINTGTRNIVGLNKIEVNDILLRNFSMVNLFHDVNANFRAIVDWFKRNNLGAPGLYNIKL